MNYEKTAKRLESRMTEMGVKACDLAKKTGINKSSISQYLGGSHTPGNSSALKIAKVLGGNPMWYMGFDVPFSYSTEMEINRLLPKLTDAQQIALLEVVKGMVNQNETN